MDKRITFFFIYISLRPKTRRLPIDKSHPGGPGSRYIIVYIIYTYRMSSISHPPTQTSRRRIDLARLCWRPRSARIALDVAVRQTRELARYFHLLIIIIHWLLECIRRRIDIISFIQRYTKYENKQPRRLGPRKSSILYVFDIQPYRGIHCTRLNYRDHIWFTLKTQSIHTGVIIIRHV